MNNKIMYVNGKDIVGQVKVRTLDVDKYQNMVEALKYTLDFANEGYPKYDQIHVRMMLETALKESEK